MRHESKASDKFQLTRGHIAVNTSRTVNINKSRIPKASGFVNVHAVAKMVRQC